MFRQFDLRTTNRLQAFIVADNGAAKRIVDYVQFDGPSNVRNLADELAYQDPRNKAASSMWLTNGYGLNNPPPTKGLINQIDSSKTHNNIPPNSWVRPANTPSGFSELEEAYFFAAFF